MHGLAAGCEALNQRGQRDLSFRELSTRRRKAKCLRPLCPFIILCVSVFGILFWNMGVAKLGPLNAGLFANFTPVITYLIAIAQGRIPGALELMGAAIVLIALIVNNRHQRSKVGRIEV
ncbi:MAG: EamA family transporter [Pseudomonadota bacterium]